MMYSNLRCPWWAAVVVAVSLFSCSGPGAVVIDQPEVETPAFEDNRLPIDDDVIVGTLDNGLTYFVRHNSRPANRAELRLVVDAGSVLEDDDQLGLAHFLEHMAFNGTENFEKQSLVDYLESIGTRFGPDLNAYTSAEETVYMLEVRTDSAEQLTTGFDVLREWAGRMSLEDDEIERERGVVLEEWRLGRGAGARVRDKHLPILLKGSRYAERMPIGDPEILKSFSPTVLKRFYADWYRPSLMAVVAVGDFDSESIEAEIIERFADMANPTDSRERRQFGVPGHEESLVSIATDPELPYGAIYVVFKRDAEEEGTVEAFRADLVESLYNSMLEARFDELLQSADPPFTAGFSQSGSFARGAEFLVLSAIVRDGLYERALSTLLEESSRVRQHGFTEGELERQRTEYLRYYQRALSEKDKTESSRFASEYIRHYLEEEPIPGIEREFDLVNKLLPAITVTEVNELSRRFLTRENRVVQVSAPESEVASIPDEEQLLALFPQIESRNTEPYEDLVLDVPLMQNRPLPGSIVEEINHEKIGVLEMRLSNGIRVLAKPTSFKNDEILLSAYSPGGYSLAPDSLFVPASMAANLISASGVGAFGPTELQKKMMGKLGFVVPSISLMSEGFRGTTSPDDLETVLQLLHLLVTEPRADREAFESIKTRMGSMLLSAQASPGQAFSDTISVTMSQYHPLARPFSEAMLEEMDLETSFDHYRERFADMGDFTFYFVGAFDTDTLRSYTARYLASLPATGRVETWRDVGIATAQGNIQKTVERGIEPQSQVRLIYSGSAEWTQDERRLLSMMTSAFQIKLREILREDLGGTYGVGVSGNLARYPSQRYQINISFACDPERVDELISTVFTQVDSLQSFGLPNSYLQKVRESTTRSHETGLEQNGFWLSALSFNDQNDLPLANIPEGIVRFVENLTTADLQSAANRYFDTPNVAKFVLRPEREE